MSSAFDFIHLIYFRVNCSSYACRLSLFLAPSFTTILNLQVYKFPHWRGALISSQFDLD